MIRNMPKSYTMYLDESGDATLNLGANNDFPILTIAGCIFEDEYYKGYADPFFRHFKQFFFGSPDVVLTSRMIRRQLGPCAILADSTVRKYFYSDLNSIISRLRVVIIATIIFKECYCNLRMAGETNAYNLSFDFLLERFQYFLYPHDNGKMIFESRGNSENKSIRDTYKSRKAHGTKYTKSFHLINRLSFNKKIQNDTGLQIADLVAYPISQSFLYPNRNNPAYEVIRGKLRKDQRTGNVMGFGIKIFPGNHKGFQRHGA